MSLDFWFDYSCPYAYLASFVAERAASLRGETLSWQPMLLGGIFRERGVSQNLMNELGAAKGAHNRDDLRRWAELLAVPFSFPDGHPFRTVEALRATLACGLDPKVIRGFYRAYWVDNTPVSDPAVIERVLREAGATAAPGDFKDELRARTDRALSLGIFGAPAIVADGALGWGLDRLPFVTGRSFAETYDVPAPTFPAGHAHTLDLYWDFSSPFAYLGQAQAASLARRTGATLRWKPMLLGGLFRSIGQADAPIATFSDAKRDYVMKDLHRWAAHLGVPFAFPDKFPMSTVKALRAWLALPEARRDAFRERTFHAYWAEGRDISDDAVLSELVGDDAAEVMTRTQAPEIKQRLIDATNAAKDRGVFGAPTWIVDDAELFWGQDRIPFVERALAR